jgi:hypothetical protein
MVPEIRQLETRKTYSAAFFGEERDRLWSVAPSGSRPTVPASPGLWV